MSCQTRAAKTLSSSGVRPSFSISTRSASITRTSAIDRGNHAAMTIEVRPLIAISSRLASTRLAAAEWPPGSGIRSIVSMMWR